MNRRLHVDEEGNVIDHSAVATSLHQLSCVCQSMGGGDGLRQAKEYGEESLEMIQSIPHDILEKDNTCFTSIISTSGKK